MAIGTEETDNIETCQGKVESNTCFLIVFRNKRIIVIRKHFKFFTRCPKSKMQRAPIFIFSNRTSLNGKWNQPQMLAKVIGTQPHMVFFFRSIDEFSGISHFMNFT